MKKLLNRPDQVVEDMLQGLVGTHGGWARLAGFSVLLRSDIEQVRQQQVAIISGGGSGHEPAHAGYVGAGMLSAAVAGEVFTSPSTNSIFAAIQAVAGPRGVLLIVKNYTGDRLNFGMAAEMARAAGIQTEMVIVADDVALAESEENAGRRGLAGTVLVHKIAGAAALEGTNLSEVAAAARTAAQHLATIGVSLSAGTVPAVGKPSFVLGESEIELGLGIHGEPGVRRMALLSADELAAQLVVSLVSAHQIQPQERIAVLLNNLGATTNMELAIVARGALNALQARELVVERFYAGTFLSSLDTAGVSLSILRVDDVTLQRLDAPTSAPAWPNGSAEPPKAGPSNIISSVQKRVTPAPQKTRTPSSRGRTLESAIMAVCRALLESEARLTELDTAVGDGDLGSGLARGARAIEANLSSYPLDDLPQTLTALGVTFQEAVGGSSGPLYGVLLLRAAQSLALSHVDQPKAWAEALIDGCAAVSQLGGATAGDRTMLDALLPFAHSLLADIQLNHPLKQSLERAAAKAEAAAEATAQMIPRRGRSSYLGDRAIGSPDPGAMAAALWLRALASSWTSVAF